jgi:hypothetical protein
MIRIVFICSRNIREVALSQAGMGAARLPMVENDHKSI